jgi:DNA-binding FadR family transcriptional regulator
MTRDSNGCERGIGSAAPRSEHAHRQLARLIRCGSIRAGDSLPSERHMCLIFGMARGSLRPAIERLKSDGVVRIHHGARSAG